MTSPARGFAVARRLPAALLLAAAPGCILTIDNDYHDANYTSGVRAERPLEPADDDWLARSARDLADGLALFDAPRDGEHHVTRVGVAIGQQLYTPEDIDRRGLDPDDRPYAAWLFGGLVRRDVFHDDDPARRRDRLITTTIDVGIVGQGALGEETQRGVHDLFNDKEPEGWGNQLENEPGVLASVVGHWRLAYGPPPAPRAPGWDVIGEAGGWLGNVRTAARVGGQLRVGWDLPRSIDPTLVDGPGRDCACGAHETGDSFYGFVGGDVELVLQDITLDGNTFTSSHSVDREPWVATARAGLAWVSGPLAIRWAFVVRSDQFEQQERSHAYSSVVLAWRPSFADAGGVP